VSAGWVPHDPWIGGRAQPGRGGPLDRVDPSTGEPGSPVSIPTSDQVDDAVTEARAAFTDRRWRGIPVLERQRILMRVAALIRRHDEELADLIADEVGMPVAAARYIEVPYAAGVFDYYAGLAAGATGETLPVDVPGVPPGYLAYSERRPVGVVAQITPFNFPLLLPAWKVAPALAAGCAVVLKPAPEASRTALALAVLAEQAGVPPGVLNVLPGPAWVGEALIAHPDVDKVSFTGSTTAGRRVAQIAGGELKRVSLELGGKSPALVFADADLDTAVSQCLFGVYFNSGQVCQATSRILVQASVYDAFVERFVGRARSLQLGPAKDPLTDLGPLAGEARRDRVERMVERARQEGALVACGGTRLDRPGFFYAPTVLVDVDPESEIAQEEVFGPVAAVMPFDDVQDGMRLANGTRYGLAAAVFTRDIHRAWTVLRQLHAGTTWVNTNQVLSPTAPFGGVKQSGVGRELGRPGLDAYLEWHTVLVDLSDNPPLYF
jgi:phenylacetaldehyde dehydrogenase